MCGHAGDTRVRAEVVVEGFLVAVFASSVEGRDWTVVVIVVLGVLYFLVAFGVTWVRASPSERQRWHYRSRHDGGGGLLSRLPEDPSERRSVRRLFVLSIALAVAGVGAGAGLVCAGYVVAGVVVFVVAAAYSGVFRIAYLRRIGLMPHRGGHRTS
jgi:hypothetical protein